jgi:hypothetical protein
MALQVNLALYNPLGIAEARGRKSKSAPLQETQGCGTLKYHSQLERIPV